jgi:hypothetical protein
MGTKFSGMNTINRVLQKRHDHHEVSEAAFTGRVTQLSGGRTICLWGDPLEEASAIEAIALGRCIGALDFDELTLVPLGAAVGQACTPR